MAWVAIHGLADGENVESTILNRPIYELVERTAFLHQWLSGLVGAGLFESVQLTEVPLTTTGTEAPAVQDFVYLDPALGTYSKALATVSLLDSYTADATSFAVGLLTTKETTTGTIVLYGKTALTSNGSGWTLSELLESNETFRNGPYYLSALESGKMTANPSGPHVYLGYFMEDADSAGTGDFALLSPQYKDIAESHVHRAYQILTQPAGRNSFSGTLPTDTHSVLGFQGDTVPAAGDDIARLVPLGTWTGLADTTYTIWLSNLIGTTIGTSAAPTDFTDSYLHWTSSDGAEGSGYSRVWSYDSPVAIGTKGLLASLENIDDTDWDSPYIVAADAVGKRTWTLEAPTQTGGWLARDYRQYFDSYASVDNKLSFILIGGPHSSSDDRNFDTVTVKALDFFPLTYTGQPTDGDTITIDGAIFEMDSNSAVTAGNTSVTIGATSAETYTNLVNAIVNRALPNVDVAIAVASDNVHIGSAVAGGPTISESLGNATLGTVVQGDGNLLAGTAPNLWIYDKDRIMLVTDYWTSVAYWTPEDLDNGLRIIAIPYNDSGTAATANTIVVGDYWTSEIADEAPGANFMYAMGMQAAFLAHYPPVPKGVATFVLNGVELNSDAIFTSSESTYGIGNSTLYWYSALYADVPWARDWVSVLNPGTYTMQGIFYFVRQSQSTGVVTSLRPHTGSPIKVYQCGTQDNGNVGDLALDLDLNMETEDSTLPGYQVVKDTDGQKLIRGPVVERIVVVPPLTLTQSAGAASGQGVVELSTGDTFAGEFEEVALENAKQQLIGMFPYVQLLGWTTGGSANVPTGFVAKFRVPHTLDPTSQYRVIVYMTVFGETDIAWMADAYRLTAGVEFTYNVLPDFSAITLSEAWNTLTAGLMEGTTLTAEIPFGDDSIASPDNIYDAYDPMLIHNNASETPSTDVQRKIAHVLGSSFPTTGDFPATPYVKAGSLVAIRVSRADVADATKEYTGKLGFINIRWRLVRVN